MRIPILSGVYTSNGPDVRVSYPVNMVPVPGSNGVSNGFLRPAEGIVLAAEGSGVCRGLYNWSGVLYGVFGTDFVSIAADHTITTLGTVADGGPVTMVNSFERLAIASGGRLYYWDLSTLVEVTDPNLGVCLDVDWVGGYFVSTDGEFIVTTSLSDPTVIRPFDYANPESSPDPVVAVLRTRNEINALGRITIEVFANVGGLGFPLATIPGAQVQKGLIGTHACCKFVETIAFLGSGDNEAPGIYLGTNATAQKVSTYEIDVLLSSYTETQLADVVMESRNDSAHEHLYIHLPDRTLVFDFTASQELGQSVWFTLTSSLDGFSQYRGRYFTWCHDRWYCGDPTTANLGYLDANVSTHYGDAVRWEFSTGMVYNEGHGGIIDQLELVALPGRITVDGDPYIATSFSLDGMTFSGDVSLRVGAIGERTLRAIWRRCGKWRNYRIQRFRGDSDAQVAFLRLEAAVRPLVR